VSDNTAAALLSPFQAGDATAHAPLTGVRVLMVDPFDASRSVLRQSIAQLGCKSFNAASTYADAMRVLRRAEGTVDLIFCEFNLNGTRDGQQLLEELRSERLVSLRTAFFMVTGESSYKSVVSVAEFAPDDYLIKPYSTDILHRRLSRTLYKKRVLAPAYELIESGVTKAAVEACLTIGQAHKIFLADCWRMAIDVLISAGEDKRAEQLLQRLLALKAVPWAVLGLAGVKARAGDLGSAAQMLEKLLADNPDFLRVHDVLADIKIKQGQQEEAMRVLKMAASKSSANVHRMRRVGQLAEALGDTETAERAFAQVLDRTRDSAMLSGEDYGNLSRLLVAQGKNDLAEQLAGDQRRMMKGHKDLDMSTAMLAFHRALQEDEAAIDAAVQKMIEIEARDLSAEVSPRLVVQVIRACLDHGQDEAGFQIAGRLAKRNGLDAAVLHDVREILDQHRAQQKRQRPMTADELDAAVKLVYDTGFDEAMRQRIERSLAALLRKGPDVHVEAIAKLWAATRGKYGIA
jgi:DNA-binding NarL/FixJ family response regulator/Flp pilus assembly protein TadD